MKVSNQQPFREIAIEQYYTSHYESLNPSLSQNFLPVASYTRYLSFLPENRDIRILEAGCGTGNLLLFLQQVGYTNVTGVDASIQQIEICKQRGLSQIYCMNILEFLQDQEEEFDYIIAFDLVEHLTRQEIFNFLGLARNCLRNGGSIFLRTPNMNNPFNIRSRYVDITHEVGLTQESIRQLLLLTGFSPVSIKGDYQPIDAWYMRLIFDKFLFWLFTLFYRFTMHLSAAIIPGKNLLVLAHVNLDNDVKVGSNLADSLRTEQEKSERQDFT